MNAWIYNFSWLQNHFLFVLWSQKAKELGYDQSLMARLYKSLVSSDKHLFSSIFLRVQYRMHPAICEFPAKYIYGNKLKSDGYDFSPHKSVTQKTMMLHPCCICGSV